MSGDAAASTVIGIIVGYVLVMLTLSALEWAQHRRDTREHRETYKRLRAAITPPRSLKREGKS